MESRWEDLVSFLQRAKKNTFASRIRVPKKNRDGSKEYYYSEGNFEYIDKYYGSTVDTGKELVFHNEKLLWSMSYRGGMKSHKELQRRCFSFLKKALRDPPKDFPVRGPKNFKLRDFKYRNNYDGSLLDFIGREEIFWRGTRIYLRDYFGGVAVINRG
jgi:hypothetical protein|tara:strand:+ start:2181 stop:2654 length:474 start_codon:yes stop_codon:yes gene_type:complete